MLLCSYSNDSFCSYCSCSYSWAKEDHCPCSWGWSSFYPCWSWKSDQLLRGQLILLLEDAKLDEGGHLPLLLISLELDGELLLLQLL